VIVNHSTNVNKTNNYLSPQLSEHTYKTDHDICLWETRSWCWTGTQMWQRETA